MLGGVRDVASAIISPAIISAVFKLDTVFPKDLFSDYLVSMLRPACLSV